MSKIVTVVCRYRMLHTKLIGKIRVSVYGCFVDELKAHRKALRKYVREYKKSHPCKCGASHPACLQFHHRNSRKKVIEISTAIRLGWTFEQLKKEMDKCEVICSNCHLILHDEDKK